MKTFAENIISFYTSLNPAASLPKGIQFMFPYKDPLAAQYAGHFYQKYYNDAQPRRLILGINPGRFGAGVTGIPFTDPKRLKEHCGIDFTGQVTHEPSSVFVYDMILKYGGVKRFYEDFYISSICPLGLVKSTKKEGVVNYNYYDDARLSKALTKFILQSLKLQLEFGISREVCYCWGTGKNSRFLEALNTKHKLFKKIIPLEHPRFIMQYKLKKKEEYIEKYMKSFNEEM